MEFLHTCYRISDIDRSVAFYEALGFEERRRMPIREEAINVFMGLPGDTDKLELTTTSASTPTRSARATGTSQSASTTSPRRSRV
jgi:catechol 2,3-dioxygenase-like lactoylglutathione lyase family enzyme